MKDFIRSRIMIKTRILQTSMTLLIASYSILAFAEHGIAREGTPFTVEADEQLEWDQKRGTYSATGNAVAKQDDQQINAEELVASYDPDGNSRKITLIVATGNVEYSDDTTTATGDRLTYNIDAEKYLIEGVASFVTGPNGTMRANKSIELMSSNPEKQLLIAIGAAQYTGAEGQVVEGETIKAHLDSKGKLEILDADGEVKLVSENGQVATGDSVIYYQRTSKALLTGNVEILDDGNIMRGSRAEVDFDTGISRILSDGSGKRVSGTLQPDQSK